MQQTQVVAEISITRLESAGFGWTLTSIDWPGERAGISPTPTDAVHEAIDKLREDDALAGVVAIYSWDGASVAHAPLWSVPSYDALRWCESAPIIDLEEMAGNLGASLVVS